jgi:hypothetical protein
MNENDPVIVVSTKNELISNGYIPSNINKEFIYQGNSFLLKQFGIRAFPYSPIFGKSPYNYKTIPRKPIWSLKLNDLIIEIHNIY